MENSIREIYFLVGSSTTKALDYYPIKRFELKFCCHVTHWHQISMVAFHIVIKVIFPLVLIFYLCNWHYRVPRLARGSMLVGWLVILHIARSLWWQDRGRSGVLV